MLKKCHLLIDKKKVLLVLFLLIELWHKYYAYTHLQKSEYMLYFENKSFEKVTWSNFQIPLGEVFISAVFFKQKYAYACNRIFLVSVYNSNNVVWNLIRFHANYQILEYTL